MTDRATLVVDLAVRNADTTRIDVGARVETRSIRQADPAGRAIHAQH